MQYPMVDQVMLLGVAMRMVLEVMHTDMVVVIGPVSSTMVEEVGDMVEAMATVGPLATVEGLALALVGPCMGPVDMVLVMVMVAMEAAMALTVVVGGMEDTIHMGDRDVSMFKRHLRHICLRMS